jgi:hypothetical protein
VLAGRPEAVGGQQRAVDPVEVLRRLRRRWACCCFFTRVRHVVSLVELATDRSSSSPWSGLSDGSRGVPR